MLATLAAFAAQAAVVYKWTDADGVIHFSDQPVPGAEKIHTSAGSLNGAVAPARSNLDVPQAGAQKEAPVLGYTEFAIASPVANQTFFGDEPINVGLALEPAIKSNHTLSWHLNGKELEDQGSNATQFKLPHLDRGTYAIAATITDPQSGESRSTESVTFYVRQPSELSPQHQKP
ncbi:MAG TPA: DUF4124 domain-containing protein [Steroidobacteraceae bacterium]